MFRPLPPDLTGHTHDNIGSLYFSPKSLDLNLEIRRRSTFPVTATVANCQTEEGLLTSSEPSHLSFPSYSLVIGYF